MQTKNAVREGDGIQEKGRRLRLLWLHATRTLPDDEMMQWIGHGYVLDVNGIRWGFQFKTPTHKVARKERNTVNLFGVLSGLRNLILPEGVTLDKKYLVDAIGLAILRQLGGTPNQCVNRITLQSLMYKEPRVNGRKNGIVAILPGASETNLLQPRTLLARREVFVMYA